MIPLRDDQPSSRRPVVTIALIAVNVALFLYELVLGERLEPFLMQAAFVPAKLFGGGGVPGGDLQVDNALLSMFLHGGWAHIGGNMLFLWIFGDNVEDRLGHFRFTVFYLACGFIASYAHAFANPHSGMPAVGASGAIAGVLGAYLYLYPKARVLTAVVLGFYVSTVAVPALVYLPIWFLLQLISGVLAVARTSAETQAGGVAFWAHIGGFVAGPIVLLLLGGRRRPPRQVTMQPWR
ncbi:MAG TPA: rhomboid family intramembrane serine protease [Thermoanaerobaculia bacterium]|nr:rhomboid family intramembrane serine protease [Thermoanaerobaculia bacterium]